MKTTAKAPGKVIITGEHFVVHGSYALAAAINRYTTVHAEPSDRTIIVSKNLGLTAEPPNKVPERLRPLTEALKITLNHLGEKSRLKIEVEGDIPVSAGLGSSASGAAALVAASSSALGYNLKPEDIFNLAMVSEKLVHGNPSGVDPAVSVHGGVILFKKGPPIRSVRLKSPVELVIGFSGVDRRTSDMIERFSEAKTKYPSMFESLVRSSSSLSELAASALTKGDMQTLAAILNFHHKVLAALGISSDILDRMVEEALNLGCLAAKLTGGGGGGCIIALPRLGEAEAVVDGLKRSFADAFTVNIPSRGLQVWREKV